MIGPVGFKLIHTPQVVSFIMIEIR